MKSFLFSLLLGLIGLTLLAATDGGATYRYVRWTGNEVITIDEPAGESLKGQIVIGDDAFLEAEFCEAGSKYICFFSPQYTFAIPKFFDGSVKSWKVREATFELLEKEVTITIFGRRLSGLFLIKAPAEATAAGLETGKPSFFLFSPEDGLVGFSSYGAGPTYWLEGKIGFGASVTNGAPRKPAQ